MDALGVAEGLGFALFWCLVPTIEVAHEGGGGGISHKLTMTF
jgi:hypothetical protein